MTPDEMCSRLLAEVETAARIEKCAAAAHDSYYNITARNSADAYVFVKDETYRQEWRDVVRAVFGALDAP